MPGLGVDMARFAGVDEQRAPGLGDIVCVFVGTERIVAACNHQRRERQGITRIGAECHQMLRADRWIGHIRRCYQEGASDRHALQLVGAAPAGPNLPWLMCALVLPFEAGSEEFRGFRDKAAAALGFALAPGGFRSLERTRTGTFKLRRLDPTPG